MTSWIDIASAFGSIAGGVAAAAGLFYAGRQVALTRNQQQQDEQWRRTEFARSLMDRLSTDEELSFCARALDWGVGPLIIPTKYRVLFRPKQETFDHELPMMIAALQVDLQPNWDDPRSLTYRYSFDTFFSYIETLLYYVDRNYLSRDQLIGLGYYLDLIKNPFYIDSRFVDAENPMKLFTERYYPELSRLIWSKDH